MPNLPNAGAPAANFRTCACSQTVRREPATYTVVLKCTAGPAGVALTTTSRGKGRVLHALQAPPAPPWAPPHAHVSVADPPHGAAECELKVSLSRMHAMAVAHSCRTAPPCCATTGACRLCTFFAVMALLNTPECKPGYGNVNGVCTACEVGTFQPVNGHVDTTFCEPCPAGATNHLAASTSCPGEHQ